MSLKNYYAILGVPRNAAAEEIRSAFRTAAKKYHPDKAPDNPFAGAQFSELQEAYEVLSNDGRRARYDEECWLRGLYQTKNRNRITPEWLLGEAKKLRAHMATVDTFRMSHEALKEYVMALLSDEHLGILHHATHLHEPIIHELLQSLQRLHARYVETVAQRLILLAGENNDLREEAGSWMHARKREAFWDRYRPLFVMLAVLLITFLIWRLR